tara:strand:- start:270 stop:560 length:291 start_codon:yes stop_codon:yes gene_type:complete
MANNNDTPLHPVGVIFLSVTVGSVAHVYDDLVASDDRYEGCAPEWDTLPPRVQHQLIRDITGILDSNHIGQQANDLMEAAIREYLDEVVQEAREGG